MARRRGTETLGDMARSIGLVLLLVAAIAGFAILSSPRTPAVRDVDATVVVDGARQAAPFAVVALPELPEDWTTTSASFDPRGDVATLRLDYVTGAGTYVGVVQTNDGEPGDVVVASLPTARPDGQTSVDGQVWERWRESSGDDPDVALVTERGDSVVLLIGSGDYAELEDVASRLR